MYLFFVHCFFICQVGALEQDFQFVGTAFEVSVFLFKDGQIATGLGDLPVAVSLAFEEGTGAPPPSMLALDSAAQVVNGRSTFVVRLMNVSMDVSNRKVCLVVEATKNGKEWGHLWGRREYHRVK